MWGMEGGGGGGLAVGGQPQVSPWWCSLRHSIRGIVTRKEIPADQGGGLMGHFFEGAEGRGYPSQQAFHLVKVTNSETRKAFRKLRGGSGGLEALIGYRHPGVWDVHGMLRPRSFAFIEQMRLWTMNASRESAWAFGMRDPIVARCVFQARAQIKADERSQEYVLRALRTDTHPRYPTLLFLVF